MTMQTYSIIKLYLRDRHEIRKEMTNHLHQITFVTTVPETPGAINL